MQIALLNTEERIAQWFQRDYPEVQLYQVTDSDFLEADTMILNASYTIDSENFEILPMWKKFLEVNKQKDRRLVVLGTKPFRSTNYLYIKEMPPNLAAWIQETQWVKDKPEYPLGKESSILQPLSKILHSHGERAFHRLLIRVRKPLREVEKALKKDMHREYIKGMESWQECEQLMSSLSRVWALRQAFFSLMPEYPQLQQFEEIEKNWKTMATQFTLASPKLSVQIGDFLENTLTVITGLYKMEKH